MVSCHSRIPNFEFPLADIEDAVQNGNLLSMEIEFSLRCNFRCPYCYVPHNSYPENELSKEEICDVILQAKDMGARKIIILGGEPTLYPNLLEMIEFIKKQKLEVEIFTNGTKITEDFAKQLYDNNVRVVLKMNSFDENHQDILTGKKGSFNSIKQALQNLKKAGYPSEEKFLAVSTIICRYNINELETMWQWLRDQNIVPYFEIITPQENAKHNKWLYVNSKELYDIFTRISEIDHSKYGQDWDPQPPLIGNRCLRHQFSCLVTSTGNVMPCVGVGIPIGNIRKQQLKNIIKNSEVLCDLKNHLNTIKGPCSTCEKAEYCYGCRGAAYQLTGDYLASDPLCWKNINRQDEIVRLPVAVDEIIPQKSPMKVIDTLISVSERCADVSVMIQKDMLFVGEDGIVDDAVYLEMMAQSIAALNGFKQLGISESAPEGFLLGAKNFEILKQSRVGDKLTISVYKYAKYGDFGVIKGTISRDDDVLAQGEIKVWHNSKPR
jgi:radical SAM protein with 4Fe4S-binding SPASM domain